MKRILVLGGGAAGILAAISAAEHSAKGTQVLLLEQNPKLGKKLLATGNGRCNLDNTNPIPSRYFSSHRAQLEEMLASIEKLDLPDWFARHGLVTRTDEAGRVYPYSNQASDLLELLLYWLERSHVQVKTDCKIRSMTSEKGGYTVVTEQGARYQADAVICAMGGKAGPQFGTDGFAFSFARQSGCVYEPIYPCLVPLQCDKRQAANLSGVRVKAAAALLEQGRPIAREEGEIQFTDYGLSGIAIMNLSGYFTPGRDKKLLEIGLDLFPQLSPGELTDLLRERGRLFARSDIGGFLTGLVQRRVGLAVWKAAGLGNENRPISSLKPEEWTRLAQAFKDWRFSSLSPKEWKLAQTTGGGIRLSLVDPNSFQSREHPGLYFVGETLDCAGQCGGFNLHWAFGTGILAGRHASGQ